MDEDRKNLVRRWSSWRNVPVKIEKIDDRVYLIFVGWHARLTFTRKEARKEVEKLILEEEAGISGVDSFEELELLMGSLGV